MSTNCIRSNFTIIKFRNGIECNPFCVHMGRLNSDVFLQFVREQLQLVIGVLLMFHLLLPVSSVCECFLDLMLYVHSWHEANSMNQTKNFQFNRVLSLCCSVECGDYVSIFYSLCSANTELVRRDFN